MVKAVFFDFGNTLAYFPGAAEREQELVALVGPERFNALRNIWLAAHRDDQLTSEEIIKRGHEAKLFSASEEQAVRRWLGDVPMVMFDDVMPTLELLKNNSIKIGMISNCMPKTGEEISTMPLAHFFDVFIYSYRIGYSKPSTELFQHALHVLQVRAEEALMVGDSVEKDVEGALSVGMHAVLLDRDDKNSYTPKITTLHDLWTFMRQLEH